MKNKLIIDGNAVYEIDDECMKKRTEEEKRKQMNHREYDKRKRPIRKSF